MVFTAYVCYNLLEFLPTIYLHTNALFEMQRKQEREMNGVCSRFGHERVCVCLSVNELNQNDLT